MEEIQSYLTRRLNELRSGPPAEETKIRIQELLELQLFILDKILAKSKHT
jgi:hypothetical protein